MASADSPSVPLISVIIPNFNHVRYLERRIESVLHQSRQDFEIVYLDDASLDNSAEVIARYEKDPRCAGRLRILQNETNSGSPFKQWNKGVEAARGKYCWIAEADDEAEPALLEKLAAVLEKQPQVGLAYCQSDAIDSNGTVLGSLRGWTDDVDAVRWTHDFVNDGRDEVQRFLAIKNTIPNASGVLFRRDVFLAAGGAEEAMRLCGDWKTWTQMLLQSDVGFVAESLNHFRSHGGSVRAGSTPTAQLALEAYQVLEWMGANIKIEPRAQRAACRQVALEWVEPLVHLRPNEAHRRTSEIWRVARRVDPHLLRHLLLAARQVLRRRTQQRLSNIGLGRFRSGRS